MSDESNVRLEVIVQCFSTASVCIMEIVLLLKEASVDVSVSLGGSSFNDSKKGDKDDEQSYSLLFAQCDTEHTGWAVVDDLIDFFRKMLSETLPNAGKNEDVYDSDDSVSIIS